MSYSSRSPLLVLPVRIIRVLDVPERAAALDGWNDREVICRRRRTSGPFESPGIPGIGPSGFATVVGPEQVSQEDQDSGSLEENSNSHNEVPRVPTATRFVGVDPPRHAQQSWDMHEVEGQVEADKEKPEMQLAERLAVHPPRHLWEPVIKGPEKGEENAAHNHIVKMGNQELEEKGNAEQHRGLQLNLSSPHGCQPVEDLDAGRNGDGHGGEYEKGIRVWAHADGEHMMGPYTHANEPDRDRGPDHHRITEDRFA